MPRSLKVAVQMDPMESVGIDGDSSFQLREGPTRRGPHRGDHLPPELGFLWTDLAAHGPDRSIGTR